MRTCASCSATGVVVCDWAAQAFLRAEGGGVGRTARTAWCFLSELESSGVPSKVADYVRDTTHTALETRAEADVQLRRGHLAIYKEMLDACDAMAAGRSQLMDRFLVSTPQLSALQAWRASQEQRASQAGDRVARPARRIGAVARPPRHRRRLPASPVLCSTSLRGHVSRQRRSCRPWPHAWLWRELRPKERSTCLRGTAKVH